MIKVLNILDIEGMYLNIIRTIFEKSITNIIVSGEKQSSSPNIMKEAKIHSLTTFVQHSTYWNNYPDQLGKEKK